MAPTVCLPELSVVRSTENLYASRRQRACRRVIIKGKHRRPELKRLADVVDVEESTTISPVKNSSYEDNNYSKESIGRNISSSNNVTTKISEKLLKRCDVTLPRREGLLSIVVRTLALVQRNRILQERVNALRAETHDFIRSVLNNPQNKCRQREDTTTTTITTTTTTGRCKDAIVSSSTEKIVVSKPTLSRVSNSLRNSSSPDIVTSTCQSPWENED